MAEFLNLMVVESLQEIEDLVQQYEIETCSHFVKEKTLQTEAIVSIHPKGRILWKLTARDDYGMNLPFDGIPFMFISASTRVCQHGKDNPSQKEKRKELKEKLMKEDHIIRKERYYAQPTKKMGCPVVIHIKSIVRFPQYMIYTETTANKRRAKKKLREALESLAEDVNNDLKSSILMETKYIVKLPDPKSHKCHIDGEVAGYSESIDPRVREKANSLIDSGLTSRLEIQECLKEYVDNDLFRGKTPPNPTRRRFYPRKKDINNMVTIRKTAARAVGDYPQVQEALKAPTDSDDIFLPEASILPGPPVRKKSRVLKDLAVRSKLKQITDLTYNIREEENFEELDRLLANVLAKAKAFAKHEENTSVVMHMTPEIKLPKSAKKRKICGAAT